MNFKVKRTRSTATQVVIEVTPIVDIVFQLLIFFLLTATFVKNPNFDINLPKASSKLTSNVNEDIRVVITREGNIRFDEKVISKSQLREILEEKFKENHNAIVLIQADKDTKHGSVVEIMDMAKSAGFTRLGIAVEVKNY